jgi:ABC-type multidrug transport system fused ATPase/permease subunit
MGRGRGHHRAVRGGTTDLASIAPAAWMPRIAVASPELELFDGSVLDNILYGMRGASAEDAIRAAEQTGADAFIQALPQGCLTRVGNRGTELSAGQRQRIALARAVLRAPAGRAGAGRLLSGQVSRRRGSDRCLRAD